MNILITGVAGFIGFHLAKTLLKLGSNIIGVDNTNNYYDPKLKLARINELILQSCSTNFEFKNGDIADRALIKDLFESTEFDVVVHLAAQAGVRYSIENPSAYIDSNLIGFANILEGCRKSRIKHLVYASSSSVYGMSNSQPLKVNDRTDYPVSLYAATKKSNELMAHTYSHLYGLPCTGLRFFTVYGPFGRPDMAYYKFTKAILEGKPIDIYNNGNMSRDFTYIDDIVEGVIRVMGEVPTLAGNENTSALSRSRVFNIGNNHPVPLNEFISAIETSCGVMAKKNYLSMQPGDVYETYADISDLSQAIDFSPQTKIQDGIEKFVAWYKSFH